VLPKNPVHLVAIMRAAIEELLTGNSSDLPRLPKQVILAGHSLGGLLSIVLSEDPKLRRSLQENSITLQGVLLLAPAVDTDSPLADLASFCGGACQAPGNFCSMAHPVHWPVRQLLKLLVALGPGEKLLPQESADNYFAYGMSKDSDEYKTLSQTYQVEHVEIGGLMPLLDLMRIVQRNHWTQPADTPEIPMLVLLAECDSAVPRAAIEAFGAARGLAQFPKEGVAMSGKLRYILHVPHAPHQCLMDGIQPAPESGGDWTQDLSLPSVEKWVQAALTH